MQTLCKQRGWATPCQHQRQARTLQGHSHRECHRFSRCPSSSSSECGGGGGAIIESAPSPARCGESSLWSAGSSPPRQARGDPTQLASAAKAQFKGAPHASSRSLDRGSAARTAAAPLRSAAAAVPGVGQAGMDPTLARLDPALIPTVGGVRGESPHGLPRRHRARVAPLGTKRKRPRGGVILRAANGETLRVKSPGAV